MIHKQDEAIVKAVDAALIKVDKIFIWLRMWFGFWFNGWRIKWAGTFLKRLGRDRYTHLLFAVRWSLWCYLMDEELTPEQSAIAYADNFKAIALQNG